MLFVRIYDEELAQASYFIGCQATGEAVVVDPRRDIAVYLEEAEKHAMRIVAVTETHIHADYLSGSRELAAAGATLYVSDEGDAGHISGSTQLYGGRLMWHLDERPRVRTIIIHCQTGSRSAVVASGLRASSLWSNWRAATRAG
jgi:glyoxylase-like metal-dependent hydrolase (beta-lactamase superfamily II)